MLTTPMTTAITISQMMISKIEFLSKSRRYPRNAFTTFSSASASFGAPWKMISPRSMA